MSNFKKRSKKEKESTEIILNNVICSTYNSEQFKDNFQNCWRKNGQPIKSGKFIGNFYIKMLKS